MSTVCRSAVCNKVVCYLACVYRSIRIDLAVEHKKINIPGMVDYQHDYETSIKFND